MKSHLLALLAATALLGFLQTTRADTDITFQDFYDALSPDGDWVELEEYGYCWRPFVDDHWRPYTDGQWVYTDAGYTWLSNEPWGWATYHYGRWTKVKNWGWIWVPGYEWGPAWVSWRTNDDYIGWAALPPEAVWEPSTGFSVFVDIDYGIGPDWYAFCPVTYFCAPRLRTVCLPWRNNITIINNTVNITRIRNVNNGVIFNDGPDINIINRRAESPLRRARLEREGNFDLAALREGRLKSRLEGDSLKIPAPRVERKESRPEKLAGRAGSNQINRGWETAAKNPELAKAYRDKMREEASRSGRKPHKEIETEVQSQPPQPQPRPDAPRKRPTDSVPPQNNSDTIDPSEAAPTPPSRRRDLQDEPPSQADPRRQQREEELRNRILEQRQQQNQQSDQAEQLRRQRQQERQQQQQERQQPPQEQSGQQDAAEDARRQQAGEARERALRAQQEFEARREASRQQRQQEQNQQQEQRQQEAARQQEQQRQQQQEASRQQEQQRQQQQSQMQQQLQQQREQLQQQRQERQQQRQERRQGN